MGTYPEIERVIRAKVSLVSSKMFYFDEIPQNGNANQELLHGVVHFERIGGYNGQPPENIGLYEGREVNVALIHSGIAHLAFFPFVDKRPRFLGRWLFPSWSVSLSNILLRHSS